MLRTYGTIRMNLLYYFLLIVVYCKNLVLYLDLQQLSQYSRIQGKEKVFGREFFVGD